MYLDFKLEPAAKMTQAVPEGWNGFIYTLKGKGLFGKIQVEICLVQVYVLSIFT